MVGEKITCGIFFPFILLDSEHYVYQTQHKIIKWALELATAFVLINAELGSETEVINELKLVEGVKNNYLVYGVYDIIARIEAETMASLKDIISWKVRRIHRVRSTITMIVI